MIQKALYERASVLGLFIESESHAESEFRVIFKERIRPGGTASGRILRIGCAWQVAAINRRATSCVCDHRSVAEKLSKKFDVRSLSAPRAGARELEERLEELDILHLRVRNKATTHFGQRQEELPIGTFVLSERRLG